jgi:hypothetical protein
VSCGRILDSSIVLGSTTSGGSHPPPPSPGTTSVELGEGVYREERRVAGFILLHPFLPSFSRVSSFPPRLVSFGPGRCWSVCPWLSCRGLCARTAVVCTPFSLAGELPASSLNSPAVFIAGSISSSSASLRLVLPYLARSVSPSSVSWWSLPGPSRSAFLPSCSRLASPVMLGYTFWASCFPLRVLWSSVLGWPHLLLECVVVEPACAFPALAR